MIFWEEVQARLEGEKIKDEMVKDANDQILRDGDEVGEDGHVFFA